MKEQSDEVLGWRDFVGIGIMCFLILIGIGGCTYLRDKGEALRNNTEGDHEQRDQTNKP